MKKCFKCLATKPLEDFYPHKKSKDGRLNKCKDCTKKDVNQNRSKVGNSYDFSEKGVFRVIYKTQKRNQKLRGHGELPYTKDQLISWAYANGFKALFESWKLKDYEKDLKPSIDRIDDFKGYSFDNIHLGTWLENQKHQHLDIKTGKGTSGRRCKPLLKLNSNAEVVCEYTSYTSAAEDMGYSLEHQIKNRVKCRSGFYWAYK